MQIKHLGLTDYESTYARMKAFTAERDASSEDELWLTEHYPVYTLGQASKLEHLLRTNHIPVVQSDRGGQITYHGPGQAVIYFLLDIKRLGFGVRQYVNLLEQGMVDFLQQQAIHATTEPKAPGVYVNGKKIASLGIRIRQGCCYHGIALNVCNDLTPFNDINPCGYQGLQMTNCQQLGVNQPTTDVLNSLANIYKQLILQQTNN